MAVLTRITIALLVSLVSFPMLLTLPPAAKVLLSIRLGLLADTLLLVILPLTFVDRSILFNEGSPSLGLTIFHRTNILGPIIVQPLSKGVQLAIEGSGNGCTIVLCLLDIVILEQADAHFLQFFNFLYGSGNRLFDL